MSKNRVKLVAFFFVTILVAVFINNDRSFSQEEAADYLIGPNDVLSIFVWKEVELTRDVTVMSDGKISFPLIGDMVASGKTVSQLRADITTKLKTFIDSPEVTVIVKDSHRLIYVIGNVNRQGPFPLQAKMTVLQALSASGGFSQWADTKNIMVIRREKGAEVQLPFNYKEFVSGNKVEQNIVLKPNDTIIVP